MFNWFKKKPAPAKPEPAGKAPASIPELILCIPGNWESRESLVAGVVKATEGKYLLAGGVLMHAETQWNCRVDVCDPDPRLRDAFEWAGRVNGLKADYLGKIAEHRMVIYLIGESGAPEHAEAMARAGQALLDAGGTGIKVESTGKAFTPDQWKFLLTVPQAPNLYELYVLDSMQAENGDIFTCGMYSLGLEDAIVSGLPIQEAVDLLSVFGYYRYLEDAEISEGQTFAAEEGATSYRIRREAKQPFAGDPLFENPKGMWRLERAK